MFEEQKESQHSWRYSEEGVVPGGGDERGRRQVAQGCGNQVGEFEL